MNKQVKRVSDCPAERLAQCRGEGSPTGVKIYHVCDTGLAEGVALGRITVVLVADFDRVRAERDALQLLLNVADQRVCDLQKDLTKARELLRAVHVGELFGPEDWEMISAYLNQHGIVSKCDSCDGTGDLVDIIGEWRGYCCCAAGIELKNRKPATPIAHNVDESCGQDAEAAEACQFPQSCTTMCDCNQGRLPCACKPEAKVDLPTDRDELMDLVMRSADAYWYADRKIGGPGAVKWIRDDETHALFIYTRGEYEERLRHFVMSLEGTLP